MAKKSPVTSISSQIAIAAKASREISVPAHVPLEQIDMPFWSSVIAEFARSEWTEHQLELAAMLARTMADLEREQKLLREEGAVAYSEKGTPVANPRKTIIQMHASTILSFRRSLQLNARAKEDANSIGKKREITKKIEAQLDSVGDDELIPRLRAV